MLISGPPKAIFFRLFRFIVHSVSLSKTIEINKYINLLKKLKVLVDGALPEADLSSREINTDSGGVEITHRTLSRRRNTPSVGTLLTFIFWSRTILLTPP